MTGAEAVTDGKIYRDAAQTSKDLLRAEEFTVHQCER